MSTTEPTDETRTALERAWADGYSQGATPGQPRPGNPWSAPVSGIWRALTDDQSLATLLFVEQRGEELFAAPVTVGYNYADERAVGLPATASSLGTVLTVWLGLSDRIRWDVLMSRSATVEGFDTLRSMEGLTPGIPILNLSGRRQKEREELRSAMRAFAVSSPSAARRSPVASSKEALPTEPGFYGGPRGGRWELDAEGQWWFRGYADRPHPTPDQQDRTETDVRTFGMPLVHEAAPSEHPQRIAPNLRVDLVDAARDRIESVWADVPGGVDALTLAQNIVSAQEFLWMSQQMPVVVPAAPSEEVTEALDVIAHIVSQATVNPVAGDDGFISRYDMPVGSIHKAIPFLHRHGVVVDSFGAVLKSPSGYPDGAAVPVETEPARVALAVSGRQSGKSARMVDQILDRANERGIEVSIIEPVETVATVEELPVGSVFIGHYYPPTFGLPSERKLASMQFTRGRSIIYGERCEYPLTQRFERIDVLFRPIREEAQR